MCACGCDTTRNITKRQLNLLRQQTLFFAYPMAGLMMKRIGCGTKPVRQWAMPNCLLSTWCMAMADVEQMAAWIKDGQIGRLDAYVGEIFPNQYVDEFVALCDAVRQTGGRVAVFRNHSKIFAGTGPDGAFAIESSANINTNPRAEQTAIHMSQDLFDHYKAFFDGITPFNKDFPDWTPIAA